MNSTQLAIGPVDHTRNRLKTAALVLFAEHGIDAVSVRDIVLAAETRNKASVYYYFGTKEALIRELVIEGAQRIDQHRNEALDKLENLGEPLTISALARLLIETSIGAGGFENPASAGYLRFVETMRVNHLKLFLDCLENRWNSGYQRCLRHLELLLAPMPTALLNQRLIFMSIYIGANLAARERAMEQIEGSSKLWRTPWAIDNLVDSLCGLLSWEPALDTVQRAGEAQRSQRVKKLSPSKR